VLRPGAAGEDDLNSLAANRSQSSVPHPVRLVWHLMDLDPDVRRKDALAYLTSCGIAVFTARTQYQLWRQDRERRMLAAQFEEIAAPEPDPDELFFDGSKLLRI
jgi:hypothetical protein